MPCAGSQGSSARSKAGWPVAEVAAVEGGDGKALADISELVDPVAAVTRVAVKFEESRTGCRTVFRPQVFGVDACATHAAEPQVEAFGLRGTDGMSGHQFGLGVGGVEFTQRGAPVVVEIGGERT